MTFDRNTTSKIDNPICTLSPWFNSVFLTRHCEILPLNQAVMIRDLDSRHGTLVNEIRVKNTELNHGDKVQIGLSIFEVVFRSNVMDHDINIRAATNNNWQRVNSDLIR